MAVQPLFNEGITTALVVSAFGHIVPSEADGEDTSPSPVRRLFVGRSDHNREITVRQNER
jgi:hypothetical protein